jgi:glycosyltransferase involved in cell wall biosynthesis
MESPFISIVIPVYNNPDLLKNTIESVIQQSYTNFEIIVVDDGSDVDLSPIIKGFDDNRIFYFILKSNCFAKNQIKFRYLHHEI